jgi:hypothetical protein
MGSISLNHTVSFVYIGRVKVVVRSFCELVLGRLFNVNDRPKLAGHLTFITDATLPTSVQTQLENEGKSNFHTLRLMKNLKD